MSKLIIYTDGGARGNPGPSGIGVHIVSKGDYHQYIGEATNNQAEYRAVILALEKAKLFRAQQLQFYLDSELVVKQLNQQYKIKDKELAKLFVKIWNLRLNFKKTTFSYIPREKNKLADKLVNKALDEAGK